jgi:hypothetical protein
MRTRAAELFFGRERERLRGGGDQSLPVAAASAVAKYAERDAYDSFTFSRKTNASQSDHCSSVTGRRRN